VTGVDFSPVAIERARTLAGPAALEATFVVADAQRLPAELHGAFDCVFASHGVLMWIADLDSWMRSTARALRAGGSLLLVEGHPVSLLVRSVDPPAFEGPYQGGGSVERELPDYARPDSATSHDRAIHYRWGLGDVVTAAVAAGIAVDALTEWMDDQVGAPPGGKVVRGDDGRFRMRVAGADLPLVYSLRATKRR
jgi:SAM-dependent methyltransferase